MKFTNYATAEEFTCDVLDILGRREIQNNLFYKNIGDGKFMATVKDDCGNVILTAARTHPFPMVIYETDNIRNDDAVAFFAEALVANGIEVDFIMTEQELAKSFCEHYGELTGKDYFNNESLVLYVLSELNDIAHVSGSFRRANAGDMFYLPYWYADFQPACGIGEYDLENGIKAAGRSVDSGGAFVWVDGHPVSVAAKVRQTSDCAFIGQVYTPPNLRGKGYSTACMWHLSKTLLDDGFKYCGLYADCANPYSNRVYQKVGYKEVFRYDQYKLTK